MFSTFNAARFKDARESQLRRILFLSVLVLVSPCWASMAAEASPSRLIVKLRGEGPEAITECAEMLWRSGRSFKSAHSADSEELDQFHERFETSKIRALFRRPQGRSFAEQLAAMTARGERVGRRALSHISPPGLQVLERGEKLGSQMAELAHVYSFEMPAGSDLRVAQASLRQSSGVEWVQVDYPHSLDQLVIPNDPFLSREGSWGQPYADLWGLHRIRAPEAWLTSQGQGIVIAVIDTGLDTAHPDIVANLWVNPGEDLNGNGRVDESDRNGIDDDGNGFIDDLNGWNFVGFGDSLDNGETSMGDGDLFDDIGHGTHVAGIAAAVGGNGIGIAGVAPAAQIMTLKGFSPDGSARASVLWGAVLYAIEQGARVINASWSCSPHCPDNPLAAHVLAIAEAAGVVFVTSAGNETIDVLVNAPENTRAVITVGSIGFDDEISSFSNRGWLVDVVAPGGGPSTPRSVLSARRNILSLFSSGTDPIEAAFTIDEDYYRLAGTSMASPAVAGAVAVLLAKEPKLSTSEVRRRLRTSARDLGTPGHDAIYGPGLLDSTKLLHTPQPNLSLGINEPSVNQIFNPDAGPIIVRGHVSGKDLQAYSIAYSRSLVRGPFEEIATTSIAASSEGILATWDVAGFAEGPVVLRLRAELRNGDLVDEYAVFAFERNQPMRLSNGDEDEGEPAISGHTVVWRTLRNRLGRAELIQVGGFDRRGAVKEPRTLYESPRRPRQLNIYSGGVVWLETDPDTRGHLIVGCERRRSPWMRSFKGWKNPIPCLPINYVASSERLDPIGFARRRIVWSPRVDGTRAGLMTCSLRGKGGCDPENLQSGEPAPVGTRVLDFDGRTVLWTTGGLGGLRVELCTFRRKQTGCQPVTVEFPSRMLVVGAAIDGTLLALESFDTRGSSISYCEVDLITGVCDLHQIGIREAGTTPTVSGKRIAWVRTINGKPASIAFCELDPFDGECRVQEVTGGLTPGIAPILSRRHLAWQDERYGPVQVLGTRLPSLNAPGFLHLKSGRRQIRIIRSRDSDGSPLTLSLEGVDGISPQAVGARLEMGAKGITRLVLEPSRSVEGEGRWRLVGRGKGGWMTQQSIQVDVRARVKHRPHRRHGHHRRVRSRRSSNSF